MNEFNNFITQRTSYKVLQEEKMHKKIKILITISNSS